MKPGWVYCADLSEADLAELDRLAQMGRAMVKPGVELIESSKPRTLEDFAFDLGFREGMARSKVNGGRSQQDQ